MLGGRKKKSISIIRRMLGTLPPDGRGHCQVYRKATLPSARACSPACFLSMHRQGCAKQVHMLEPEPQQWGTRQHPLPQPLLPSTLPASMRPAWNSITCMQSLSLRGTIALQSQRTDYTQCWPGTQRKQMVLDSKVSDSRPG